MLWVPLLLSAIFIIGIGAWLFSTSIHRHEENNATYGSSNTYEADKNGYVACFIPFSASVTTDCIAEKIKASASAHKDKNDLNAQQDMELWAKGAFVFTGISLFVTCVGAVLIWRTHIETRAIGRAQTRAYLHISGCGYTTIQDYVFLDFEVKNSGQSRATGIKISYFIESDFFRKPRSLIPTPIATVPLLVSVQDIQAGGMRKIRIENPREITGDEIAWDQVSEHISSGRFFYINLTIRWMDVFGDSDEFHIRFVGEYDSESRDDISEVRTINGKLTESPQRT